MDYLGFREISWIYREALSNCKTYKCAVNLIKNTDTNSMFYAIVAGINPNEGTVITKDRSTVLHEDKLDESKWFVI
jgi:hypothetical protein